MDRLKLLSAGAVKRGVTRIAAAFEAESGQAVDVEFSRYRCCVSVLPAGRCLT